jgi:hypothetical protein
VNAARPAPELQGILEFPWEVLEYLSWLRRQPASSGSVGAYLFDEPKVRFGTEEEDVIVADPELRVEPHAEALRLVSPRAPQGLPLQALSVADRPAVVHLLQLLDGQRTLAEVRQLAAADARVLDALLTGAFGSVLFAPLPLIAAERSISGVEITRFPGSPYEIARPYWRNMGAVRARLVDVLDAASHDDRQLLACLRELHVVALMGADLQSYYQPASPISSGRAAPGRLMHAATVVVEAQRGSLIIRGPRVNAAPVGGARYHQLLYATLGEPEAGLPRRFLSADGLDFGRLVHGGAAADPAAQDWFCPPRPVRAEHVSALRAALHGALDAAERSRRPQCLAALAEFHQIFVRLHPFHCGNQCLAMNIVNHVLVRLLGAGVPHLMLDHLALRLSSAAYARVFRRCVEAYADARPSAPARYLRLAASRRRSFELTRLISEADSLEQARATVEAAPEAARDSLLLDE